MPQVNVLVNGRAYTVACDQGEEDHVRELGEFLNKRVGELSGSVGQVGDARLLLMAGLEERDKEIASLKSARAEAAEMLEIQDSRAADALEQAASRMQAIAARLAHS
jgi:cell division protein ZapA